MTIWVTAVTPDASLRAGPGIPSSIAVGHGTDDATGEIVTFAGEARMLNDIERHLAYGEPVAVDIESWQVLSRRPADG